MHQIRWSNLSGWVAGVLIVFGGYCFLAAPTLTIDEALENLSTETFVNHMTALSGDLMTGRRPGSPGYDAAAAYVIKESRSLGLKPGGIDNTYLQSIVFRRTQVDPTSTAFNVNGSPLTQATDFTLHPRTTRDNIDVEAPMIFAGFGISAPDLGYDDFEAIDVTGKLVVVVSGAPDHFGSLERTVLSSNASRNAELRERGAAGVVVVRLGEVRASNPSLTRYIIPADLVQDTGTPEELEASVTVSQQVAEDWIRRSGRTLENVLATIRSGVPLSFDLDIDGRVRGNFVIETFESANVAALLPGSDVDLRDEVLVLTAHLITSGRASRLMGTPSTTAHSTTHRAPRLFSRLLLCSLDGSTATLGAFPLGHGRGVRVTRIRILRPVPECLAQTHSSEPEHRRGHGNDHSRDRRARFRL